MYYGALGVSSRPQGFLAALYQFTLLRRYYSGSFVSQMYETIGRFRAVDHAYTFFDLTLMNSTSPFA